MSLSFQLPAALAIRLAEIALRSFFATDSHITPAIEPLAISPLSRRH